LEHDRLNAVESIELAHHMLPQGKGALLQKCFDEGKLECSEELSHLVSQTDATLALKIHLRANDAMWHMWDPFKLNVDPFTSTVDQV